MAASDILIIVHISTSRLAATVAERTEYGEQVLAHRSFACTWYDLNEHERRQALGAAIIEICQQAAIERVYTVFVAVSNAHISANYATGGVDLGESMILTLNEVELAKQRAGEQAIGPDRWVLHALPQRWAVRQLGLEQVFDNPVGQRGSELLCDVLLVTADAAMHHEVVRLLGECEIMVEGVIAEPVALYRGLQSTLPQTGSVLIIDFGARHTTLLVHRKERLVHMAIEDFGSEDLDDLIAEALAIAPDEAELLKQDLDVSPAASANSGDLPGQLTLWADIQAENERLGEAAQICRERLLGFFSEHRDRLLEAQLLAKKSRIHLVGRGSALHGLSTLLNEVFTMPVLFGTGKKDRDPSAEMADLVTLGLVRMAASERERLLNERDISGLRQARKRASGLLSWLAQPLE